MGRLVDIDAVRKAIKEEWERRCAKYHAKEIIDDTIHAVEQVEEVEAIPVDWIINFKNSTKAGALMEPKEVIKFILEAWKEMLEAWKGEQKG